MMGWSDMMAGGLGEGGWARTSILAALRANWIRIGVRDAVQRLTEIHLAYKKKKAFPRNKTPFIIKFHSINTALAIEKAEENQSKADYATTVATLLDMIEQGSLAGSETFKLDAMSNTGFTEEQAKKIISEITSYKDEKAKTEAAMYESVNNESSLDTRVQILVQAHISELLSIGDEANGK